MPSVACRANHDVCLHVAAALRYEDFEALLRNPTYPPNKATPPAKQSIPAAQVTRPRRSVSSSLGSSDHEPAPVLMQPPRGFQQEAPSPRRAGPAKLEERSPALLGRPAKPTPPPLEPEEEEELKAQQDGEGALQEGEEDQNAAPAAAAAISKSDVIHQQQQQVSESKLKTRRPPKPQHAKSSNAEMAAPPQLSRPPFIPPKVEEDAVPKVPASRPQSAPAGLPALMRPAAPRSGVITASTAAEEEKIQATALANLNVN